MIANHTGAGHHDARQINDIAFECRVASKRIARIRRSRIRASAPPPHHKKHVGWVERSEAQRSPRSLKRLAAHSSPGVRPTFLSLPSPAAGPAWPTEKQRTSAAASRVVSPCCCRVSCFTQSEGHPPPGGEASGASCRQRRNLL